MAIINSLKRISNILNSQLYKATQKYKSNRRAKITSKLKKKKKSDKERWEKSTELHDNWDERTKILAQFIDPNSHIIEFGAGNKSLFRFLPSNCTYSSSDIFKRFPDTIICDLNQKINFSLEPYNLAIFSGVLEYVYDLDNVFNQLNNKIDNIILSYACSDFSSVNRLERGWLSDYKKEELEEIFKKYGYKIIKYVEWNNQSIFQLLK